VNLHQQLNNKRTEFDKEKEISEQIIEEERKKSEEKLQIQKKENKEALKIQQNYLIQFSENFKEKEEQCKLKLEQCENNWSKMLQNLENKKLKNKEQFDETILNLKNEISNIANLSQNMQEKLGLFLDKTHEIFTSTRI
jgi:hypothetical protein